MKQKISLKDKQIRKQINGKFNNKFSGDENKFKKSLQKLLPLPKAQIHGLLHPHQVNRRYFLA
jgi:hypothetical protein